jgi:hypothetical protein
MIACGYLNQLTSSRRLEREAGRNVEVINRKSQSAAFGEFR